MEDSNKRNFLSQTWQSEGKFKRDWCQSFKDLGTIENRVKILQMEKLKKVKDIERKIDSHNKNVSNKIIKAQRKKAVEKLNKYHEHNLNIWSHHFRQQRKQRQNNIKRVKDLFFKNKKREFSQVKQQSQQIEKKIKQEKKQQLDEKIKKRNKVRLMEIESKQNLMSSWQKKLEYVKGDKVKLIGKKIREHQGNLIQIVKYEEKERKILDQIFHAQNMQTQITLMIQDQGNLEGENLKKLYCNKI